MKELRIINNIPAEYTALSDALSKLMYAAGSQKLCGACFEGKLHAKVWLEYKDGTAISRGCCGGCKNLAFKGCVQKPVGCAGFSCDGLRFLLPERIIQAVEVILRHAFVYPTTGRSCYSSTIEQVLEYHFKRAELSRLQTATARVVKLTRWLEKNFKPNWPFVARVTKADGGVL